MAVVEKQIRIEATPETVWRYLTNRRYLATWLMRSTFEPRVGHEFSFLKDPNDEWDGEVRSRVVECEPARRLAFTWNANTIGADTLVSIELSPQASGTLLTLRHTNWTGATGDLDRLLAGHSEGWSDHLGLLVQQLAEESRGREKDARLDWSRFDIHCAFDVPVEQVFQAWATIGGMESFFVETMQILSPAGTLRGRDEVAAAGDSYALRWYFGRRVDGEYLAVETNRSVTFTFGESRVTVDLTPCGERIMLRLRQYDIPDGEHDRMHIHTNCRAAWAHFLTLLKTRLEHGVDARDKTRATAGSMSTYFDPKLTPEVAA